MDIIGKTFGYKGIGGMVYVVIVQSFVKNIGKTTIHPHTICCGGH